MALGLSGGMLVLIILVVTSIYVVCRVKGFSLKKKEVITHVDSCSVKLRQWRIQDFPEGGVPTSKNAIIFQLFLAKTT